MTLFKQFQIAISPERLERYLLAAGGDLAGAIELYEMNLRLSQGLFGLLHGYEITLRNAMHNQLSRCFDQADWYDKAPLDRWHTGQIDRARGRCRVGRETPGKIISGLTLGFWTGLTASRYEQSLWVPCLRHAFGRRKTSRSEVHRSLQSVQDLRNRVAHHERILGCNGSLYAGLDPGTREERFARPEFVVSIIESICVETAAWISRSARLEDCLAILDSERVKSLKI